MVWLAKNPNINWYFPLASKLGGERSRKNAIPICRTAVLGRPDFSKSMGQREQLEQFS